MGWFEPSSRVNRRDALLICCTRTRTCCRRTNGIAGTDIARRPPTRAAGRNPIRACSYLYEVQRDGRASAPFVSSAILSILPGVISLIAYADCPVARECLISPEEFHFVGGVSTRGPLDHNISPQTTCVFVRPLCYARRPRKTNIIVFMYKTK